VAPAGGTYFAKYQECARDADQISDKFQRLNEELYLRRRATFQAISDATSMDSVRSSVKDLPSLYFDLKPRSIPDLNDEFRKLRARIDQSGLEPLTARFRVKEQTVPPRQMMIFGSIALGIVEKTWPDSALDNLKYFAGRYHVAFLRDYVGVRNTEFAPNCGPGTIVSLLTSTSKPDIVRGTPHPLYANVPVPSLSGASTQ
jgi:hypothetical protein